MTVADEIHKGASKNLCERILLSFLRKQESSVYHYFLQLDPRFRGDDKQKFVVFRYA